MSDAPLAVVEADVDPVTGLDRTVQTALEALAEAHDAKLWAKAAELGDAWVAARGEMPLLACVLYAQSLMGVGRYRDALPWARAASTRMPEEETTACTAAHSCYAQALARCGDYTEARRALKRMIYVPATHPEAIEKQGHVIMATSNKWAKGWAMHETRLDGKQFPPDTTLWDGVSAGPLAVVHEQGIGDAVLFARWLTKLEETHAVTWYGPKLLHRWIEGMGFRIGGSEDADLKGETIVYAMSLPHVLGCKSPLSVPRAEAPPQLMMDRQRRRFEFAREKTLRVGVCWKGATRGWHDFERSYSAEEFAPVIQDIPGVEFVNLAHDAEVPADWPFERASFGDVYDTGEVIASCDLVVSVDTSIVHLAGSLNVPTFALVPTVPDWRYEWPYSSRTPFYSSVTVCRRKHGKDQSPVRAARAMVERFARAIGVAA